MIGAIAWRAQESSMAMSALGLKRTVVSKRSAIFVLNAGVAWFAEILVTTSSKAARIVLTKSILSPFFGHSWPGTRFWIDGFKAMRIPAKRKSLTSNW